MRFVRRKPPRLVVVRGPPPNLDPVWTHPHNPPYGSLRKTLVVCGDCDQRHMLRERLRWNGTHSDCPACGSSGAYLEYDDGT